MEIHIHPHAKERMHERGVSEAEIMDTLNNGEFFPAKFGRAGFRRNFPYNTTWHSHFYYIKQVEIITVKENNRIVIITVIAKYF